MTLEEGSRYASLGLWNVSGNADLPRHRWFDFKEGFSERLVREAVGDLTGKRRRARILDPFAGSGTTLVAAGRMSLECDGIEVNPFLASAARAKCVSDGWSKVDFFRNLDRLLSATPAEIPSKLEGKSTFSEGPKNPKWLFNRSVLRGYAALSASLDVSRRFQRPLRLALIASLMDNCNAKRDGKCLRYKSDWRQRGRNSEDLRESFMARAKLVFTDVSSERFRASGLSVRRGDSRIILGELPSQHYDLLVTSPPYLNSFDYSDVYRPELFAGGFVSSNADLRRLRLETLRSHVQVNWEGSGMVASPMIQPVLKSMEGRPLWDRRLPSMIQSYFADMAVIFREAKRTIRRGGEAWIVIGTSAYAGVEIPVDLILADVASRSGWTLKNIFVLRRLRAAGQHFAKSVVEKLPFLRESLIVLKRP
jgi:DNA modification methylase